MFTLICFQKCTSQRKANHKFQILVELKLAKKTCSSVSQPLYSRNTFM